jgi:elongation factor Tu
MTKISRSVNLLLRSSRSSLGPRAVSPIQHVFNKDRLAARSFATAFERTKPVSTRERFETSLTTVAQEVVDILSKMGLVAEAVDRLQKVCA